jgi:endonuclease I
MKKSLSLLSLYYFLSLSVFSAIPSGYYDSAIGKSTAALKTELHNIICRDTANYLIYGSKTNHTWQGFYSTDRNLANNMIIDVYSDSTRYFPTNYVSLGYPGFLNVVEIEHSVPKSWWNYNTNLKEAAARDLHHLFPADGKTNIYKSNHPLGVVSGKISYQNNVSKIGVAIYNDTTGVVFEPADRYKGDFARAYFYIATAYENYYKRWINTKEDMMENDTYPTLKPWAIKMLLDWNRNDPVSEKELMRNEAVYGIQNNRNPFIDHPELADYIWGPQAGKAWSTSVTAIDDAKIKFSLSPNPVQNEISVQSDEGNLTYSVYTVTGQLLMEDHLNMNKIILVNHLSNGIYILQLKSGSRKSVGKFIVSK